MASYITLYNSYQKGLQTISGSFPIYNNIAAIQCNVNNTIQSTLAQKISDLDESFGLNFIITQESTRFDEKAIFIDVDISIFDPELTGLITSQIVI